MTDYGKILLYGEDDTSHVTDFKSVLKIIHALETGKSLSEVKDGFFIGEAPENAEKIMRDFIGEQYIPEINAAFSFYRDAGFIIGAFMEKYKIDILSENMHWHLFTALFMSLGSDTAFSAVIKMRVSEFKNGRDRIFARRFNSKYAP